MKRSSGRSKVVARVRPEATVVDSQLFEVRQDGRQQLGRSCVAPQLHGGVDVAADIDRGFLCLQEKRPRTVYVEATGRGLGATAILTIWRVLLSSFAPGPGDALRLAAGTATPPGACSVRQWFGIYPMFITTRQKPPLVCTASISRAMAALQLCSWEPSDSPVKGSKYSAKPPSASCPRVSRRICAARLVLLSWKGDHHRSQLATGHTGPRQ